MASDVEPQDIEIHKEWGALENWRFMPQQRRHPTHVQIVLPCRNVGAIIMQGLPFFQEEPESLIFM